jgi:hypothetical protein
VAPSLILDVVSILIVLIAKRALQADGQGLLAVPPRSRNAGLEIPICFVCGRV